MITLLGSAVFALALPFVALPDPASWPLLGLAILIHTPYHVCLTMACQHGDFGQVYPIARGTAPLFVTLGALIASYTLVGGLRARQAGSVLGFAVLMALGNGLLTFAIVLKWKVTEINKLDLITPMRAMNAQAWSFNV